MGYPLRFSGANDLGQDVDLEYEGVTLPVTTEVTFRTLGEQFLLRPVGRGSCIDAPWATLEKRVELSEGLPSNRPASKSRSPDSTRRRTPLTLVRCGVSLR